MAIASTAAVSGGSVVKPSGFTNPSLAALSNPIKENYEVDIAVSGNAHASVEATGLTNILAAIEAQFEATQGPTTWGLDATKTITVNLRLIKLERVTDASSIYLTGNEVYRCTVAAEYTVA